MRNFNKILVTLVFASAVLYAADLGIKDVKVGKGKEALRGTQVTVHYVGTLTNGQKFDSSRDRNRPFTFILGENQVIQGWEKGILKMREGGVRKLTIPPQMGYGERAVGSIPANSTLLFDVELLKVN
ncbi:FKBP-type peptidyl-prolyl cis-trans isomerase [Leptospira sp. GIMC2001]|uniref:FKBP-type peptidyl-prolyl cis-trans isomerase n=1 Tax=Leptospira sp. GIMC2001 TaxID=1513297 RepID=UPI00234A5B34|nr:FKBP-type peptidyl-prolyl cis-trans isomerase [Leptospira sp. GIMC2001]WCL47887.1 FKBP-type peptidyl-prolyl cis-trans isomerase [Leptospira sp. GIMC2001]